MDWSHALNVFQDALIDADRYVDQHHVVTDLHAVIDEHIRNKGLADNAKDVITTLANVLNAAAGEDTSAGA